VASTNAFAIAAGVGTAGGLPPPTPPVIWSVRCTTTRVTIGGSSNRRIGR
jgi:hypothetical protein